VTMNLLAKLKGNCILPGGQMIEFKYTMSTTVYHTEHLHQSVDHSNTASTESQLKYLKLQADWHKFRHYIIMYSHVFIDKVVIKQQIIQLNIFQTANKTYSRCIYFVY
jgi:hypothetical protein